MSRHRITKASLLLPMLCVLGAACDDPEDDVDEAEQSYIQATNTLTAGLDTANCEFITTLSADYATYYEAMTNTRYRELASTRFKPFLDYMSRKLCNELQVSGDAEAYKSDAIANAPAAEFLSSTPLLQAIVENNGDRDSLLDAANEQRTTEGLDPIIVADYPNSITLFTSTIVLIPGWPGRPELDQWLQVQRTLGEMFFVTLEPDDDGTYASFLHSRALTTDGETWTVGTSVTSTSGDCLLCHYSGKPLHMRALDNPVEAAKVDILLDYLRDYPPETNHPAYNPYPDAPGIGTSGTLTIDEASTYAGRTLTESELETLNRNTACDSCHNGSTQNALLPPFGQTVEMLMANGIRPPDTGIVDKAERDEAIKVMQAAYQDKLQRYFVDEP